jgi:mycothiol synthase
MPAPIVVAVPPSGFGDLVGPAKKIDRAVAERTGHAALGDAVWRDLTNPGSDSLALLIDDRVFAHVARSDSFSPQHWVLGVASAPDGTDDEMVRLVVEAAKAHVAARGGGRMVLWIFAAQPDDDARLARAGFLPARELYEMRVPLPLEEQPAWPAGSRVRDFVPGQDDAAWLVVNNRAFENHPDQGAWIEETLARRMAEPWFDPSLFVVAFDEEGLAGFNWCKVHPATEAEPAIGEIFVIGVDPRVAGSGLGRPLALEGLRRLADRGLSTGKLFTAADNTRALKLYRGLGFTEHRIDRAYEVDVDPA